MGQSIAMRMGKNMHMVRNTSSCVVFTNLICNDCMEVSYIIIVSVQEVEELPYIVIIALTHRNLK